MKLFSIYMIHFIITNTFVIHSNQNANNAHVYAFTSSPIIWHTRTKNRYIEPIKNKSTTSLYSNDSNSNNDKTSIDGYVLNLHGGKYRFDDPSMSGTSIGRDFAESLYSSYSDSDSDIPNNNNENESSEDIPYDEWPQWAKRMISISTIPSSTSSTSSVQEIIFSSQDDEQHRMKRIVRIQNQYRTWEPYFAKIISMTSHPNNDIPKQIFQIVGKTQGMLAPNGGTDNLCDSTKRYPDCAEIIVQYIGDDNTDPIKEMIDTNTWYLVVGTEEEKWYYVLKIL